jgi:hypothetical protein
MSLSTEVCRTQYNLEKDDFEGIIFDLHREEIVLTHGQWEAIAKEIVGRMDNFVEGLLTDLASDVLDGNYDE